MATKRLGELQPGDRVALEGRDSVAEIISAKPATWVKIAGDRAIDVQWKVVTGHGKGEKGYFIGGAEEEVHLNE